MDFYIACLNLVIALCMNLIIGLLYLIFYPSSSSSNITINYHNPKLIVFVPGRVLMDSVRQYQNAWANSSDWTEIEVFFLAVGPWPRCKLVTYAYKFRVACISISRSSSKVVIKLY